MCYRVTQSTYISIPWYALRPQFSISPTEWSRLSNIQLSHVFIRKLKNVDVPYRPICVSKWEKGLAEQIDMNVHVCVSSCVFIYYISKYYVSEIGTTFRCFCIVRKFHRTFNVEDNINIMYKLLCFQYDDNTVPFSHLKVTLKMWFLSYYHE